MDSGIEGVIREGMAADKMVARPPFMSLEPRP